MNTETGRIILAQERFALTLERLCRQLIERYDQFSEVCFVSIQPRGPFLGDRLLDKLRELGCENLTYGVLDITFYRDDFRVRQKPLKASRTEMDFIVDNKHVVLIDDVLYTGRTINAALTALNHYGRAKQVELLVLVDRRFNRHLPVRPDYTGLTVDALDEAYVKVEWQQEQGEDRILIFKDKSEARE